MRKIVTFIVNISVVAMLVLIMACNQENAFDCAKSTGEMIHVEREVAPFYYVILEDNIDLVLKNGAQAQASIKAGKNLMPKIIFKTQGDTLIISNENTCNWVRSFKHRITVTLPIREEGVMLIHRGYGEIKSSDTLQVKTIDVYSLDAGGNIDLQVNTSTALVYSNSHSFIQITGQAKHLDVWMHKGIGRVFAENLSAQTCYVKHEGSNEIRIFPVQESNVEIFASGNVLYYNEPLTMTSTIKGTGKLIKK